MTKSIPSNSVAAGVPCRVICTLEEYYAKRKEEAFAEAKEYVKMFRARFGRNPNVEELREEWIYFVDKRNLKDYPEIPVERKVGRGYEKWLEKHNAPYSSYEEFMSDIPG